MCLLFSGWLTSSALSPGHTKQKENAGNSPETPAGHFLSTFQSCLMFAQDFRWYLIGKTEKIHLFHLPMLGNIHISKSRWCQRVCSEIISLTSTPIFSRQDICKPVPGILPGPACFLKAWADSCWAQGMGTWEEAMMQGWEEVLHLCLKLLSRTQWPHRFQCSGRDHVSLFVKFSPFFDLEYSFT